MEASSGVNLTEGDVIALNCSIDGVLPPAMEIQWQQNGRPILRETDRISIDTSAPSSDGYGTYLQTSTLTVSDTHPVEDSGIYTCKVFLSSPGTPTIAGDIAISVQGVYNILQIIHSLTAFNYTYEVIMRIRRSMSVY